MAQPHALPTPVRLSIVVEWANTALNGVPRAHEMLQCLGAQWQAIGAGEIPPALPAAARDLLARLEPRAQLVIVSGAGSVELGAELRCRLEAHFELEIHVREGLEYYPLKTFGAERARGDLMLFVDSDVLPGEGWLAHLLGSFARPDVDVVCGQTTVAPTGLWARAFALGWTYALRDPSGGLVQPRKIYANNLAFRAGVFRSVGFPPVGRCSRGACSQMRSELARRGIAVWENRRAGVAHAPPSGARHLVVRALAHGRDQCWKHGEARRALGLWRCLGVASARAARGFQRTLREGAAVGVRSPQVPAVLAIIASYYACFALGGVLAAVAPGAMARRFRV